MDSHCNCFFLVLMVSLLAFTKGDKYSVTVSQTETTDDNGICYKYVTVSGNGVNDKFPIQCKMAEYIITDNLLVVGDIIYSNKAGTLVVVGVDGCEQRTYTDEVFKSATELSDNECEIVKLAMVEAFFNKDPVLDDLSLDVSDDGLNDELIASLTDGLSESQIKAYEELMEQAEDVAKPDSTKKTADNLQTDDTVNDFQ